MKKIVLTGGGTAGHVIPNFALLPYLHEDGYEVVYIGSKNGMEKNLVKKKGLTYYGISSGKLRRYFSWQNFIDPFKILLGFFQSLKALRQVRPSLVFSKGGFVSVPIVIAAWCLKVPVIAHESDFTPGLANRICQRFVKKILTTFEETLDRLPKDKGIYTGTPIREELANGDFHKGLDYCGFSKNKPVLMVMGGSLGSVKINTILRDSLSKLLESYQVIHICGHGNLDPTLNSLKGYIQFEYVNEPLKDLLACSQLVVSRSGSNAINEFAYLRLPMLLIPLSRSASRGDQILNARSFEKKGYAHVLEEESLTVEHLIDSINRLYKHRNDIRQNLLQSPLTNGTKNVYELLKHYL